ncbi:MAG: S8 family serine peptidase [Phycisphaerales bacterium]|nr:S8 family serine peptidase [Phycisphaerales bacterium]
MKTSLAITVAMLVASTASAMDPSRIAPSESGVHLDLQSPHMYRFKERKSLTYDFAQVAVHLDSVSKDLEQLDDLPVLQILADDLHVLEVPQDLRDVKGLVSLVQKLSERPGVLYASPVFINSGGQPLVASPVILAQFNDENGTDEVNSILDSMAVRPVGQQAWNALPGSYKIQSDSRNGFEILAQANKIATHGATRFAEPDMTFIGGGAAVPNDPGFPSCWGLHNTGQDVGWGPGVADMDMDILECWDTTQGDDSIIVLIIDTGTQQNHPDINQITGKDFTGDPLLNGGPGNECDYHGTPVSGCVSARVNNSIGTAGVAPGCLTVSARCFVSSLDCSGGWSASYSWTADAIDWGQDIGARVSNNSNLYGGSSAAIEALYESTRNNGMVHFACSGNDSSEFIGYPANLETVNAIGALENTGALAGFSTYGNGQSMTAPGAAIYSTDRTGADGYTNTDYSFMWGTSFASPYAAGCAALVLSVDDSLDAFEVEDILYSTATDLGSPGYDTSYGWGMVNANEAVILANGCPADLTGDDQVGINDLLQAIDQWGASGGDCNNDGTTDVADILLIIDSWGSCE